MTRPAFGIVIPQSTFVMSGELGHLYRGAVA
jgi:hypothetical protein